MRQVFDFIFIFHIFLKRCTCNIAFTDNFANKFECVIFSIAVLSLFARCQLQANNTKRSIAENDSSTNEVNEIAIEKKLLSIYTGKNNDLN